VPVADSGLSGGLSGGGVAGIIVAGVVVLAAAGGAYWWSRSRARQEQEQAVAPSDKTATPANALSSSAQHGRNAPPPSSDPAGVQVVVDNTVFPATYPVGETGEA